MLWLAILHLSCAAAFLSLADRARDLEWPV
jgi:hypothetical protein